MITLSKFFFPAARKKAFEAFSRGLTGSLNLREKHENPTNLVLSKKAAKFRILCTDINGKKSSYEVSKSSFYHELGLTVRDLRFQHDVILTARNKNIIVKFQKLKVLVCPDAILLIDPPFENDIAGLKENSVAEFWKTLPALITGSVLYTSSLPLEYRGLEAIFTHALCNFSETLATLEPEINRLLSILTDPTNLVVDRSLVHILLKNSARLNTFQTEVNEFCNAIEDILEYDEEIRSLCISANISGEKRSLYDAFVFSPADQPKKEEAQPKDHFEIRFPRAVHHKYKINLQDEMETLLDSFLKDAEEINHKVKELKEAIENSNTAILINLDSYRNLLLRFELELTIGMFSCTLFGLIGMAFGMNLDSTLEENPLAFWLVTGCMLIGTGVTWRFLLTLLRRTPMKRPSDFLKNIFTKSGNDSSLNSLKRNDCVSSISRDQDRIMKCDYLKASLEASKDKFKAKGGETNLISKPGSVNLSSGLSNCMNSTKRMKTLHGRKTVTDFFKRYSKQRQFNS